MSALRSHPPAGSRRVGARVLPAVQEPPGRVREGVLQRHRLGERGAALCQSRRGVVIWTGNV